MVPLNKASPAVVEMNRFFRYKINDILVYQLYVFFVVRVKRQCDYSVCKQCVLIYGELFVLSTKPDKWKYAKMTV